MTCAEGEYCDKKAKREKILETSSVIFCQRNYHEVTMDEIAATAGVAKGTLYNYFASKEELYFAIIREGLTSLADTLEQEVREEQSVIGKVRRIVKRLLKFFYKHRYFFAILQKEEGQLKSKNRIGCEEKWCQIRYLLKSVLQQGMDEGVFKQITAAATADMIMGMVRSLVQRRIAEKVSCQEANLLLGVLFHGLLETIEDEIRPGA